MDKNLNAILMIDQKIGDFYYDNIDLTDNEFMDKFEKTNYISKALKIISKLSNKNVLEVLIKLCIYICYYLRIND